MPGSDTINLKDALGPRATLTIEPEESAAEHASRIAAESRSKLIEDCKGVAVFAVTLIAFVLVAWLAAYEGFLNSKASPETIHWGQVGLTTLFTSSLTFLLGRTVGKASGH